MILRAVVSFVLGLSGSVVATEPAVRTSLPPPPPTVPVAPDGSSCGEWYGMALEAGWSPDEWPTVDRIMWRESRCTPDATNHNTNGSVDRGLMQVNSVHRAWLADHGVTLAMLWEPLWNLTAARWLYLRDGWRPWRATL